MMCGFWGRDKIHSSRYYKCMIILPMKQKQNLWKTGQMRDLRYIFAQDLTSVDPGRNRLITDNQQWSENLCKQW